MNDLSNTLSNLQLAWSALRPDLTDSDTLFHPLSRCEPLALQALQPRLIDTLTLFCQQREIASTLLLYMPEEASYLQWLAEETAARYASADTVSGVTYHYDGKQFCCQPATRAEDNFAAHGEVIWQSVVTEERLFGCVRQHQDEVTLQPGLIHQANGGILILPLKVLLLQPAIRLRLQQLLDEGQFHWLSPDPARPLPVTIPSMPLSLKLILVGDREYLDAFMLSEPGWYQQALYTEYETELLVDEEDTLQRWCRWVLSCLQAAGLPSADASLWPALITEAIRYSGDQAQLPLDPLWITQLLQEAGAVNPAQPLSGNALKQAVQQRHWRENYLETCLRNEYAQEQILIQTRGQVIGQINGLSVVEYPGHPRALGEPSRISCVVHFGDGDLADVERKAELGGNLHAKGMMIVQALLSSMLELEQQLPFTASMVFEQSYGGVDGDSATLAEFCALFSALAQVPLTQQIAVTGAIDQLGNVQPVGGVNEKIEGFFAICQQQGLTGQQGVIIPSRNCRHLCLNDEVVAAVQQNTFHVWAVDTVFDAITLLTGQPDPRQLLKRIQTRILQAHHQENRQAAAWWARWLGRFSAR